MEVVCVTQVGDDRGKDRDETNNRISLDGSGE